MSGDYNYMCNKCPRTFKLEEFYEKHKKVHELKKQHKCDICGFVYGAAKGLEGHLKTHTEINARNAAVAAAAVQIGSDIPPNMGYHFLNPQGVLAQAKTPSPIQTPSPKGPPSSRREKSLSSEMKIEDFRNNATSLGGSGNYKIYSSLPDLSNANAFLNKNGMYMCSLCKREFSGINSLIKHSPIHTRKIQHKCDVCGYVYGKPEYLIDHMRDHTGDVDQVCHVCGQVFDKIQKYKEHLKLHRNFNADRTIHDILPYRCHICREVFQQSEALGNHLASVHPNCNSMVQMTDTPKIKKQSFACKICGQEFARPQSLKLHTTKVHGSSKKNESSNGTMSKLDILSAKLQSKASAHYFDQKKGTQVLSCQMCDEKFMRRSDLIIHLENIHHVPVSGESPFATFEPSLQMNRTSSVEENEPPQITIQPIAKTAKRKPGPASKTNAPMDKRGSSFNIPSHLENVLFDPDKQGFECQDCGKILQHKQSLISHMRVIHGNYYGTNKWKGHSSVVDMILEESTKISPRKRKGAGSGEVNATICSVCEQVFPNQSSLRNHVVNVHIQGQNHTCDLCGKAFLSEDNLNTHIKSKHPNLNKRLQNLRDALGIEQPTSKRLRLNSDTIKATLGISTTSDLPSTSVLSLSKYSSLSCNSIVVDFPTAKDSFADNNNNNSIDEADINLLLAQQSPVDLSKSAPPMFSISDPPLISLVNSPILTTPPNPPASVNTGSTRKKNSICKVCGVVLSPKTNVNVHMRTHSGARPYQCVLCLNKFRQKAHLMKHFRCSHNQKRPPFICLFCPDECASSNDLYRHITDKHKKETDELTKVNGLVQPEEIDSITIHDEKNSLVDDVQQDNSKEEDEQMDTEQLIQESENNMEETIDEDDIRYEPITEAFMFEEQVIHPCYVVLPFVTDKEVENLCQTSVDAFYANDEVSQEEDEEGCLTIDESQIDTSELHDENDTLEDVVEKSAKEMGMSSQQLIHKPDHGNNNNSPYNAEDIKIESNPGFYPSNLVADFSLPFSLSSLWKKKMDILPPETLQQLEMMQKMDEMKRAQNTKPPKREKPKPKSKKKENQQQQQSNPSPQRQTPSPKSNRRSSAVNNTKSVDGTPTQVSDYESQVQNENWPLDCIKCDTVLTGLDNFNMHMNDHWSEDKCCPVCGLLINSKRFNFKQHLKIHTGEKPFSCKICSRSFRQKAHMVKHVTTHRSIPSNMGVAVK